MAILSDLLYSAFGFFAGVGITVSWYRLRGYRLEASRR